MVHIALIAGSILAAEFPIEAPIVPGSVALEEPGRYRSSRPYEETILFYERVFRRVAGERWHNIVNLPGIKAKNIESRRSKSHWQYINIYETRGQVRVYVIPRERPAARGALQKKREHR